MARSGSIGPAAQGVKWAHDQAEWNEKEVRSLLRTWP